MLKFYYNELLLRGTERHNVLKLFLIGVVLFCFFVMQLFVRCVAPVAVAAAFFPEPSASAVHRVHDPSHQTPRSRPSWHACK